ncbi:MAG: trpC [Acidimicrobiales bacterium]|nr:trpC [Acidimicrobiales bacterium]
MSGRGTGTVLDQIVAAHRAADAADARPVDELLARADASAGVTRDFAGALVGAGLAVIAEVKRRSPSKGELAPGLVPGLVAKAYAAGGAAALSVLTDADHFGGSPADLTDARDAVDIPVLRKDFTVSERDVADARLMGADAILLIVAALSDAELSRFVGLAGRFGLSALVEVHDERELGRALAAGATLVGVNQRDLRTFEVDHDLAATLATRMPAGIVRVAESGVRDRDDCRRLADAGFDAVLVGETLVTAPDPTAAIRSLRGED